MKTKVHKVELLIVDHDNVGADEIMDVIENQKYPNHCISPSVMSTETVEIDYHDGHPFNLTNKQTEEYERVFKK